MSILIKGISSHINEIQILTQIDPSNMTEKYMVQGRYYKASDISAIGTKWFNIESFDDKKTATNFANELRHKIEESELCQPNHEDKTDQLTL